MRLRAIPVLATLLALTSASAQVHTENLVNIRIYVIVAESRKPVLHARVDLLDVTGALQYSNYTNNDGMVEFKLITPGVYRIRTGAADMEAFTSDLFELRQGDFSTSQTVALRQKNTAQGIGVGGTVSAAELKIPGKARKEFDKAAQAVDKGDLPEAKKHFQKAIDIYPEYARAYNDLGVVFMRSGERERGRQSFEKAIALDNKYSEALLNLAKVRVAEKNTTVAEELLLRAVANSPANPEMLTVLANVQLMENKYAEAAANASKVHGIGDAQYPIAHWIAGRAYEVQHKDAQAINEYTIFLKESPSGTQADEARASLKTLRDQNHPN